MAIHKLREKELKSLEVGRKHFDGGGLYFEPKEPGAGPFRYKYRLKGRELTYTIGWYPEEFSLEAIRSAHQRAVDQVKAGIHPVEQRREKRAEHSAATLAALIDETDTLAQWINQWMQAVKAQSGWSDRHGRKVRERIEKHLGKESIYRKKIGAIGAADIAPVIERIAQNTPDTAKRVASYLSATFNYAGSHGRVSADPVGMAIKGVLFKRRRHTKERTNQPAIIDLLELGELMVRAERSDSAFALRNVHILVAYTAQRIELCASARWSQFHLDKREWRIPREDMKTKDPNRNRYHTVFLTQPVLDMLARLPRPVPGEPDFLFPSEKAAKGHITIEGVEKFYQRLGLTGRHVPHGWRSALMTNANDCMTVDRRGYKVHRFDAHDAKSVLDHKMEDSLQRAYDRGERVEAKREVLNWWASELERAAKAAVSTPQTVAVPSSRAKKHK